MDARVTLFSPRNEIYFSFACSIWGEAFRLSEGKHFIDLDSFFSPYPFLLVLLLLLQFYWSYWLYKGIRKESNFEREKENGLKCSSWKEMTLYRAGLLGTQSVDLCIFVQDSKPMESQVPSLSPEGVEVWSICICVTSALCLLSGMSWWKDE